MVILHTYPQCIHWFYLQAFYGTEIESIEIPKSVTEIYDGAFHSTPLEGVSFEPNSQLVSIGDGVSYFLLRILRSWSSFTHFLFIVSIDRHFMELILHR